MYYLLFADKEGVLKKLEVLVMGLLEKIVNRSKPFQIALMNIAFCNFHEKSKVSIQQFFSPKKVCSQIQPCQSEGDFGEAKPECMNTCNKREFSGSHTASTDNHNFITSRDIKSCNSKSENIKPCSSKSEDFKLDDAKNENIGPCNSAHKSGLINKQSNDIIGSKRKLTDNNGSFFKKRSKFDSSSKSMCSSELILNITSRNKASCDITPGNDIDPCVFVQLPEDIKAELLSQLSPEQKTKLALTSASTDCNVSGKLHSTEQTCTNNLFTCAKAKFQSSKEGAEIHPQKNFTDSCVNQSDRFTEYNVHETPELESRSEDCDNPTPIQCNDIGHVDTCAVQSPNSAFALPSNIDKNVFNALPADIQKDIICEHSRQNSQTNTSRNVVLPKVKGFERKNKGKRKRDNGNIMSFFKPK